MVPPVSLLLVYVLLGPVSERFQWYPPSENNTDVFGRGANDAKGSIACQITAFLELRDAGLLQEGDVCLMYDVGEEQYGDGMRTFVDSLTYTPEWIMVSPAMILIY